MQNVPQDVKLFKSASHALKAHRKSLVIFSRAYSLLCNFFCVKITELAFLRRVEPTMPVSFLACNSFCIYRRAS